MSGVFRNLLPATAYKTYSLKQPAQSHFKDSTCQEVDCPNYLSGWKTVVDVSSELGGQQANYIRNKSGRSFTVEETGSLVTFTFPPGQKCFNQHRVPLEREPLYIIRDGDLRGNPTGKRKSVAAEEFVEEYQENSQSLRDFQERD